MRGCCCYGGGGDELNAGTKVVERETSLGLDRIPRGLMVVGREYSDASAPLRSSFRLAC